MAGKWTWRPSPRVGRPHTRGAGCALTPTIPQGLYLKRFERERMHELCLNTSAAVIADEVFADYGFSADAERVVTHAQSSQVLTFTLSGLSKICALPQMKLGWIVVSGPPHLRKEAQARLEIIADTYLSVSAPVALAAPRWLADRCCAQSQILERGRANLRKLDELLFARLAGDTIESRGRLVRHSARALHPQRRRLGGGTDHPRGRLRASGTLLRFPLRGLSRPKLAARARRFRRRGEQSCFTRLRAKLKRPHLFFVKGRAEEAL